MGIEGAWVNLSVSILYRGGALWISIVPTSFFSYSISLKLATLVYYSFQLTVSVQIFEGSRNVNVSHIIHDLSFGPKYPGIHNPLDGTDRILHDTSGTFKYYIKVSNLNFIWVNIQLFGRFKYLVSAIYTGLFHARLCKNACLSLSLKMNAIFSFPSVTSGR